MKNPSSASLTGALVDGSSSSVPSAPVNPCGFALLPAWITHTLGDTTTDAFPVRMARALRAGTALTLGFAGTLAAAGLAVSAGARALIAAAPRLGFLSLAGSVPLADIARCATALAGQSDPAFDWVIAASPARLWPKRTSAPTST